MIKNTGTITGGLNAEEAISLRASNATNTGAILGNTVLPQVLGADGGTGGVGVYLSSGSNLVNYGSIIGGMGGFSFEHDGGAGVGGNCGAGVVINSGLLINAGTIMGGAGGGGTYRDGSLGYAVQFSGSGVLDVEPGAVFIGNVVADAGANDILEVSGTSTTALTGIGTQFPNFKDIYFDFIDGAERTIEANLAGLANGTQIFGMAIGDTIVLDGFAETSAFYSVDYGADGVVTLTNDGVTNDISLSILYEDDLLISADGSNTKLAIENDISSKTLKKGDFDYVFQYGRAANLTVDKGAGLTVEGGTLTTATLKTSAPASVTSGGLITDATVDKKAFLLVTSGGVADSATLAGGTLSLADSAKLLGNLAFNGSGGELIVHGTVLPSVVISGFAAGDKIELANAAAASGTVEVTNAGMVTISAGDQTYALNIADATVGETNFKFSNYTLTETAPKMAIQRPPASQAQTASALPALDVSAYQTSAAPSQWTASAARYSGSPLDLIQVPQGGSPTIVTLQSG